MAKRWATFRSCGVLPSRQHSGRLGSAFTLPTGGASRFANTTKEFVSMSNLLQVVIVSWMCVGFVAGCSGGSEKVKLVPADGIVTYQGKPLAGATVTFVPKTGPLAQAITDLEGKFSLATGTLPGVTVGPVQVTVSAFPPGKSNSGGSTGVPGDPKSAEDSAAFLKAAGEMQQSMSEAKDTEVATSKSLVPERYLKAETSGLQFTVKADGDNHFKIELQD